jgi:hypothetical protein
MSHVSTRIEGIYILNNEAGNIFKLILIFQEYQNLIHQTFPFHVILF